MEIQGILFAVAVENYQACINQPFPLNKRARQEHSILMFGHIFQMFWDIWHDLRFRLDRVIYSDDKCFRIRFAQLKNCGPQIAHACPPSMRMSAEFEYQLGHCVASIRFGQTMPDGASIQPSLWT